MADKKSLVEEALLQMKNLEEVVAENAKGILASTMKGEIAELVKESLKKETDEQEEDEMGIEMDSMDDMDDEEGIEIDMDMDDMDMEDEDEFDVEDMEDEMEMDFDMDSEDEQPIDLTNASDEEILKVFKSMGDEDGIIVKKDNNQITLEDEDSDEEYIIQLEGDMEDGIMNEENMERVEMEEADDLSDEDLDNLMANIFRSEMEEEMYEEDVEKSYEMEEEDNMEEGDVVYEITMDEDDEETMEEDESVNENKFTVKPKIGTLKKSLLTTKAETKEGSMMSKPVVGKGVKTGSANFKYEEGKKMETKEAAIEPKGRAKGLGMNLSPKKFEYTEAKKFGGNKDEYKRKEGHKTGDVKGHYKDYEGKVGGNKDDESKTHPGKKDYEKEETKEAARTLSNGSRNYPKRYALPKLKVKPNSALSEEVVRLREKNEEYRKALNVFREKLNEVAVFNSNLAYATRLFTEHTTTKQEKINILRRFDDVESLKESKSLYGSIKNELTSNNQSVVTESMSKIEKSPSSGSAQNLIESKTYENPQFLRMKDIMSKIVK
jgi:hypothetical protein